MRFQVSWIRDIKDAPVNVSFVINAESEWMIREFCGKSSIVIFEVKPFLEAPESFGKVSLKVAFDGNVYEVITNFENVSDAYMFFTAVQWNIQYINQADHPLSDEDIKTLLKNRSASEDAFDDFLNDRLQEIISA